MSNEAILTEDQIDVFRELINIAYGRAAGLLHEFTHAEVQLHVPEVAFFDYDGFLADIKQSMSSEMVVSEQAFNGQISGETLMLVSANDADKLSRLLHHTDQPSRAQTLSSVFEIGNIITTSSTQILSDLSHVPLAFNSPVTHFYSEQGLQKMLENIDYSRVISISTYLDIPDQNVFSKIYYLFYREAIHLLSKSLTY